MPTDNYTDVASTYIAKFLAQNRNNDSAALTANEQIDRDNLLHFIEDNFKTGVKGGITAENLRAVLHAIVKSTSIIADDDTTRSIFTRSGRVTSTGATKHYYGSSTYGLNYTSWSSYTSNLANFSASGSNSAFLLPYDIYGATLKGTISKTTNYGDVSVSAYYSDKDDGTNTYVQNLTLIGKDTVTLTANNTPTQFTITSSSPQDKISADKLIWVVVTNDSWSSGNEYISFTCQFYGKERSGNWTSS